MNGKDKPDLNRTENKSAGAAALKESAVRPTTAAARAGRRMSLEKKLGVAFIGILLGVFCVVLAVRLAGVDDDQQRVDINLGTADDVATEPTPGAAPIASVDTKSTTAFAAGMSPPTNRAQGLPATPPQMPTLGRTAAPTTMPAASSPSSTPATAVGAYPSGGNRYGPAPTAGGATASFAAASATLPPSPAVGGSATPPSVSMPSTTVASSPQMRPYGSATTPSPSSPQAATGTAPTVSFPPSPPPAGYHTTPTTSTVAVSNGAADNPLRGGVASLGAPPSGASGGLASISGASPPASQGTTASMTTPRYGAAPSVGTPSNAASPTTAASAAMATGSLASSAGAWPTTTDRYRNESTIASTPSTLAPRSSTATEPRPISQEITSAQPLSAAGASRTSPAPLSTSSPYGAVGATTSGGALTSAAPTAFAETPKPYVVAADDSFWSISEKMYGDGAYYRALFAFNSDRYPHAEDVRTGSVLDIPSAETLRSKFPELCGQVGGTMAAGGASPAVAGRGNVAVGAKTYIVQEGDTLFDIARRQLGKASYWSEIYNLNRQTLGDSLENLRPGTELHLPEIPAR